MQNLQEEPMLHQVQIKMVYVCQSCSETIKETQIKHRVICPYCSSRVLFKARSISNKPVKAR